MTPLNDIELARFNMIEQQIRPWDVLDTTVLALLGVVKREDFVPLAHRSLAFVDIEVPLPAGQSMLSPKVEARLLQELNLRRHERVLEIGAGSGYMAALLSHRARQVVTLEIEPALARLASENLAKAAVANVSVIEGDGSKTLPTAGPFDAILLSGSVSSVPQALLSQLNVGGRLVAIVGMEPVMQAVQVTRVGERDYRTVELFDTMASRLSGFDEPSRFHF
jgi:protein-L-isoaspartate(D-aspartate) O-methyltransferase